MKFENDERIVMTLDAGGTNFVFSAIRSNKEIIQPVVMPANGSDLEQCLSNIISGFSRVKENLPYAPSAISFAFPGPADYPLGIIGDLGNLPAFRGGIALGPMLEEHFKLPVFINNDGDLFVYGEAIAGFLPYVNTLLEEAGSPKRYNNLFGVTLGTGFGAGIVRNGELFTGDNSGAGEIWLLRNKVNPAINAEEGASIRAVRKVYAEALKINPEDAPEPREIFDIAEGKIPGSRGAAVHAFNQMAEVVGDAMANALTLIDGLAVIGGGIAGAHKLFLPEIVKEMNSSYLLPSGKCFPRLAVKTFNLEDENELKVFLKGDKKEVKVPGSSRTVAYDPLRRLGVGISKLGTSKAVSVGAYAFALNKMDSGL